MSGMRQSEARHILRLGGWARCIFCHNTHPTQPFVNSKKWLGRKDTTVIKSCGYCTDCCKYFHVHKEETKNG